VTSLYVETSALLTWLFNEPGEHSVRSGIEKSHRCVSSVLTIVEAERAFRRALHENLLTTADYRKILGFFRSMIRSWTFLEITESVRRRAGESFPVEPVRTLDALHLASALELQGVYVDLEILSLDRRIVENLVPLGLCLSSDVPRS